MDGLLIWICLTVVSTGLLAYVAYERGRSPAWGVLGLVLGIIGLVVGIIILIAMPSKPREPRP